MGFDVDKFPGGLDRVKLSAVLADAGYTLIAAEQNGDSASGVSLRRTPLISAARRLGVGLLTKLFDYQFSGAVQNTTLWRYLFSTMAMTQGSGTLLMNVNSITTSSTGCLLSTWRQISFSGNGATQVEVEILFTEQPLANQVVVVGAFPHASATVQPTDGVYFRYTPAGLIGVINYNGVETPTGVLLTPADFVNNKMYTLRMDVSNAGVDFWRDDTLLATLATANANGQPMLFAALPISLQFLNSGPVSGSPVMQAKIASVTATLRDIAAEKMWQDQQAGLGLNAAQGAEGGTLGTTALYSNSLAAGAGAAMTNTTAALGTGLGGQFSALPTLAVPTDGIVCSYQNPAGSLTQPPRTIMIRGVRIDAVVTTVLAGNATPVIYILSLAFGHSAVSMATAESTSFTTSTAKAPRRIPLGVMSFGAAAALGTVQSVVQQFNVPIAVNPVEFVAICAKNVGVVTTTGVVTFLVSYDAYLE